ncbi:MAG: CPBP family intramembrane metalloprotease [Anaerolineales bacterium]|nr:CPBP family intramembrane metalloprotease [Anaerolineales bacterium]
MPSDAWQPAAYAPACVIVAPLMEEPVCRGFILRAWMRRGVLAGVLLPGLPFGLVHSQIAGLLPPAFPGIVLGVPV